MSADLDRFDRMLLGVAPASPTRATFRTTAQTFIARATAPAPAKHPTKAERIAARQAYRRDLDAGRAPVITSVRPSRFVGHVDCAYCGAKLVGVEDHGESIDGSRFHKLAAHSPEMRSVQNGRPRCLGSGQRVARVALPEGAR